MQQTRLDALIERNLLLVGNGLGCTDVAEHMINSKRPPIKQRYYPLTSVVQTPLNKEFDKMRLRAIEKLKSPW